MAKNAKDITEKILFDKEDVFADIFNVLVYDGEQVIKPEELVSADSVSHLKIANSIHMQERDVSKIWTIENVRLSLLGIENPTVKDRDMPLRIMGYDGAAYNTQVKQHKDADAKQKEGKTGFEAMRLPVYPVVSLVLYFGKTKWSWPKSLLDCMQVEIPDKLRPFVSDYKINVIDVSWLDEETVKKFNSDFRIVADYFVQTRKRGNQYNPPKDTIHHVEEVLNFLKAATGDDRFVEILADMNFQASMKKGEVNMCEVLDKVEKKGMEKGLETGIKAMVECYQKPC